MVVLTFGSRTTRSSTFWLLHHYQLIGQLPALLCHTLHGIGGLMFNLHYARHASIDFAVTAWRVEMVELFGKLGLVRTAKQTPYSQALLPLTRRGFLAGQNPNLLQRPGCTAKSVDGSNSRIGFEGAVKLNRAGSSISGYHTMACLNLGSS